MSRVVFFCVTFRFIFIF